VHESDEDDDDDKNNQPSAAMTVNNRPTRVATARAVHRQTPQTDKLVANYI